MAKDNSPKSAEEIQNLLDERSKILQWLDRLNMASEDTPSDVRDRVRLDYETRLDAVAQELRGYTDDLQATLTEHQGNFAILVDSEKDAETRMAEAKLRHAVGEYSESKWNDIHSEILGELVKVREELKGARGEIHRLEEVLGLIHGGRSAAETTRATPPPVPEPPTSPPARTPPAPRAEPAGARKDGEQPANFDELAFLKSVSEDEDQGPDATRATGKEGATSEPIPPTRVSQELPVIPDEIEDGPSIKVREAPKKTLKCQECGAMNFPTEWYCERCGAELASI